MNHYINDCLLDMNILCYKLDVLEEKLNILKQAISQSSQSFRFRGNYTVGFQVSPQIRINALRGKLLKKEKTFARLMGHLELAYDRYMMLIR